MSSAGKTFTDQRSAHERLKDLRKAAQALVDVYETIPDENPDPVRTQAWQTLRGELQGSAGAKHEEPHICMHWQMSDSCPTCNPGEIVNPHVQPNTVQPPMVITCGRCLRPMRQQLMGNMICDYCERS